MATTLRENILVVISVVTFWHSESAQLWLRYALVPPITIMLCRIISRLEEYINIRHQPSYAGMAYSIALAMKGSVHEGKSAYCTLPSAVPTLSIISVWKQHLCPSEQSLERAALLILHLSLPPVFALHLPLR